MKINSSYRDNPAVKIKERFVLDIYQLASQLLPESDVKSMSIVDIIKEVISKNAKTVFYVFANNNN